MPRRPRTPPRRAEPLSYPENPVIKTWSDYIRDPAARRRAFEIMSSHVFLNSGFAAGTPRSLSRYLREGDHLLNSTALHSVAPGAISRRSTCFATPIPKPGSRSPEHGTTRSRVETRADYGIGRDGQIELSNGQPIHVVHGNALSFRWNEVFWSCLSARQRSIYAASSSHPRRGGNLG